MMKMTQSIEKVVKNTSKKPVKSAVVNSCCMASCTYVSSATESLLANISNKLGLSFTIYQK